MNEYFISYFQLDIGSFYNLLIEKVTGLLVVPKGPTQPWHSMVMKMFTVLPFLILHKPHLLILPHTMDNVVQGYCNFCFLFLYV